MLKTKQKPQIAGLSYKLPQNLRKIKALHPVNYSKDFPQNKQTALSVYANVKDVLLKRAALSTFEGQANILVNYSEHQEQERIRANPPICDRTYVERAEYTLLDFYADYTERMAITLILYNLRLKIFGHIALTSFDDILNWTDYQAERKKWRRCRHRFCLNLYPINPENFQHQKAKRIDSLFCCEACRKAHHDSVKLFKKTGSYLPIYHYLPQLSESIDDSYRLHENPSQDKKIETRQEKKFPETPITIKKKPIVGGKVTTFKSLEHAKEMHENADRTGWISI